MTRLGRARIVRGGGGDAATTHEAAPVASEAPRRRRVAADELRAREAAAALLEGARKQAETIVAEARVAAEVALREAANEAREAEEARGAALLLRLKREDEQRAERDLDRAVSLAVVLAERLLGAALVRDPGQVIALANQALREARGARRATIDACPLDAAVLERHLVDAGFESHTVEVRTDPSLSRGSLRVSTNLGTLDARLHPQLERLAQALRDALERA